MDEHERTIRAARQVDLRIGFYVHFALFLLVCTGLIIVNWWATPQIWWAQWPLVGWGIGVWGTLYARSAVGDLTSSLSGDCERSGN
jgi:hypothetical protein